MLVCRIGYLLSVRPEGPCIRLEDCWHSFVNTVFLLKCTLYEKLPFNQGPSLAGVLSCHNGACNVFRRKSICGTARTHWPVRVGGEVYMEKVREHLESETLCWSPMWEYGIVSGEVYCVVCLCEDGHDFWGQGSKRGLTQPLLWLVVQHVGPSCVVCSHTFMFLCDRCYSPATSSVY